MKRLLVVLCVLGLFFSACKKDTVTYPATASGSNKTVMLTIPADSWVTTDNGVSYYASLNVPAITAAAADNDAVSAYISYGNNVYEQIPEVYQGVSYSYTYSTGNVTVYAQSPGAAEAINAPPAVTLKVVLVSSAQ